MTVDARIQSKTINAIAIHSGVRLGLLLAVLVTIPALAVTAGIASNIQDKEATLGLAYLFALLLAALVCIGLSRIVFSSVSKANRRAETDGQFVTKIPKAEMGGYKWRWAAESFLLKMLFSFIVNFIALQLHGRYASGFEFINPILACYLATYLMLKRMIRKGAAVTEPR